LNTLLDSLHPYPFERLKELTQSIVPSRAHTPINLSIGEPKHPTPKVVTEAWCRDLKGLSVYPATSGSEALKSAMVAWLQSRYGLKGLDPMRHVLPVNGSREALFAFAQVVIDPHLKPVVVAPNPFYQIYEGAALLAGGRTYLVPQLAENQFRCEWAKVPEAVWQQTSLLFVCSPGNPTGSVIGLDEWQVLFELSERYGFVIASDECYSEIYFDEGKPPMGALEAAQALGRDFSRLVSFTSLSKRSNCPGMRSGFVSGDPLLIKKFLLYRTYHGSAMNLVVQQASIAAWSDESHVIENRRAYKAKFEAVMPLLGPLLHCQWPEAGFYVWGKVPGGNDVQFALDLLARFNVQVLPGSLLARELKPADSLPLNGQANPGQGFIRLALVEPEAACLEGAQRIVALMSQYGAH
jgi:N-succinyldiaminopimelate aminotransferase